MSLFVDCPLRLSFPSYVFQLLSMFGQVNGFALHLIGTRQILGLHLVLCDVEAGVEAIHVLSFSWMSRALLLVAQYRVLMFVRLIGRLSLLVLFHINLYHFFGRRLESTGILWERAFLPAELLDHWQGYAFFVVLCLDFTVLLFLLGNDEFILVTNLEILLVERHGRLVIEQVLRSEAAVHILQVIVVARVGAYVL